MSAEDAVLARIREHFCEAIKARDHLHHRLESVMKYLPELIERHKAVNAENDGLKADLSTEKARGDAAEAERDQLKQQIASDEADAQAALGSASVVQPAPAGGAPVVTTTATGATISVDDAAATHVDPTSGITTTVPRNGSAPTAADAAGISVTPDPASVADAQAATQAVSAAAAPAA